MRYVLLIYLDDAPFAAMSEAERRSYGDAMLEYDAKLGLSGNFVLGEALRRPREAATVLVRDGQLLATDGPFVETKEYLSGIFVIEARDMNDAIRLTADMPLATVGAVEIRPIKNHPGEE